MVTTATIGGYTLVSDVIKISEVVYTQDQKLQNIISLTGKVVEILINGALDPADAIQLMNREGSVVISSGCCVASCDFPVPNGDGVPTTTGQTVNRVVVTPPLSEAEKADIRLFLKKLAAAAVTI